jgi:hypothetical protein
MKKLSNSYEISADNMISMSESYKVKGFNIIEGEFFSEYDGDIVPVNILESDNQDKQIFSMKDGTFILEAEEDGDIEYYYSYNIIDLL